MPGEQIKVGDDKYLQPEVACGSTGMPPFIKGVYMKIFFILLDMYFDVNTIVTLLGSHQYKFGFCMTGIVSFSILQQVLVGNLLGLREAVRKSVEMGVLRDDLVAIIQEEQGLEAFLSLFITSYSLIYCATGHLRGENT